MKKIVVGVNDLRTTHPELLDEWDYEKNNKLGIFPDKVSRGSHEKVWWVCKKCGYEWKSVIYIRSNGTGCPACSGRKVLPGYNDLASKRPDLAKEWNCEKNGDLKPTDVTYGSGKKVWWKCNLCGNEWQADVSHRVVSGTGCPACAGQQVLSGYNDLATKRPDLLKEWNYEKNGDLLPSQVMCGSDRKVWWKCKNGHEWIARVANRTKDKGRCCPFCSGKKVLSGYNDLATVRPDLSKEWNYEKNGRLKPTMFTCDSNEKVWWKCSKGHEWKTAISSRNRGTGCPECYADKQTSFPEQAIYYFLDKYFHGKVNNRYKFKDEKGSIEADIYLPKFSIVVEYDGVYWHKNRQEKDLEKEARFKALGINFIRIAEHNKNKVVDNCIFYDCYKNRDENLTWAIQELFTMLNVNIVSVNVSAFRDKILELSRKNEVKNSLATTNPELAKEWNYGKNGMLKPSMFTCNSNEKVWWKCKEGHEWQTMIANRVRNGTGCPVCAGKQVLTGYNDLDTLNKKLSLEWNYEKNGDLKPTHVTCGSGKKVWWKCNNGHEWQATIASRNRGNGCPICSGKQVLPSYSDLATSRPDLVKEWNYEKNGDLKPTDVTCGSSKKVWWKCKNGHEWQAKVRDRDNGTGCPICSGREVLSGYNDLATLRPDLVKEWNYEKNGDLLPSQVTCNSNKKVWWKCNKGHEWQATVGNRNNGNGCPICTSKKVLSGYNDLATLRPDLVKEWDYEKNGDLLPSQVTCNSNKKVWWKCKEGHKWQAQIMKRNYGRGCPVCAGQQVLAGYNDLASKRPDLAKEWNYEKNGDLLPSQVMCGSDKKVWWKCSICGYEWLARIANRTKGRGCPACAKKVKK